MSASATVPSLSRRRSSGANLAPLVIPPLDDSEPVRPVFLVGISEKDEVVEEGKELFKNFFREELEKEKACADHVELQVISTPQEYRNPLWAKAGRNLRQMADQFARTQERQRVRQQAEAIGEGVTYENFRELMTELFAGGVTTERLIVLFYFCSDVAINALRVGRDLFQRFWNWSMTFIVETVCTWVQRNGGWGAVLRSPFNSGYKIFFWFAALVGAFSLYRYLRFRSL